MKYLRLDSLDPYLNLAIEEYLFESESDEVMMLWQNSPSVVVGKNQNIRAEVDIAALRSHGILPVRRITGGGAVYHDGGNINYTFISKRGEDGIDFATFSKPVIDALRGLGVTLTLSGRNDLCLPDGRKVSGNAQCARGDRLLHHGTLLFDSDLERLGAVLTPDEEKLKTKAVKSTRSRVANLRELLPHVGSAVELIDLIEKHIIDNMHPEVIAAPTGDKINALRERNGSEEWLFPASGISAKYSLTRKKRYPFGTVEAELSFLGERIGEARLFGDFFSAADISGLEELLRGKGKRELCEMLTDGFVLEHIHGMRAEELIELIFGES